MNHLNYDLDIGYGSGANHGLVWDWSGDLDLLSEFNCDDLRFSISIWYFIGHLSLGLDIRPASAENQDIDCPWPWPTFEVIVRATSLKLNTMQMLNMKTHTKILKKIVYIGQRLMYPIMEEE